MGSHSLHCCPLEPCWDWSLNAPSSVPTEAVGVTASAFTIHLVLLCHVQCHPILLLFWLALWFLHYCSPKHPFQSQLISALVLNTGLLSADSKALMGIPVHDPSAVGREYANQTHLWFIVRSVPLGCVNSSRRVKLPETSSPSTTYQRGYYYYTFLLILDTWWENDSHGLHTYSILKE